jgi:hypothetical protein
MKATSREIPQAANRVVGVLGLSRRAAGRTVGEKLHVRRSIRRKSLGYSSSHGNFAARRDWVLLR